MKKLIVLIVTGVVGYYAYTHPNQSEVSPKAPISQSRTNVEGQNLKSAPSDSLTRAFKQQLSNVQVEASGVVDKVLGDDNDGSRHQRFIVRLASGQTVLIAHNIDLAPRVALSVGDRIQFAGEYEWNNKGGVVHWTHRDPNKRHQAGWIKRNGETFQ